MSKTSRRIGVVLLTATEWEAEYCTPSGAKLGEHMVSRAQLDSIASRIETLAPKSDRVVGVWRNRGETVEQALERHYLKSPADRFAGQQAMRRQDISDLEACIFVHTGVPSSRETF